MSLDVKYKYAWAHVVMHINTKKVSQHHSCSLTGNQHKGIKWSNFIALVTILKANFCTAWSSFRLDWVVLLQKEEQ